MGIIVWLIVGGIVGWLASIVMRTDAQQGIILNVVVGIVGAVIAGFVTGANINNGITVMSFLYSLLGAIVLLAIVNLVRNAVQAGGSEPVRLVVNTEGDRARIMVLNRPRTDRPVQPGMGVGVLVARAIVEAHGGTVGYSYADPYVTFSVRLPLSVAPAAK